MFTVIKIDKKNGIVYVGNAKKKFEKIDIDLFSYTPAINDKVERYENGDEVIWVKADDNINSRNIEDNLKMNSNQQVRTHEQYNFEQKILDIIFGGRIGRLGFIIFTIASFLIACIYFDSHHVRYIRFRDFSNIWMLLSVVVFSIGIVKRCHDMNIPGMYGIIVFIIVLFIGLIFNSSSSTREISRLSVACLIPFLVKKGDSEANQYGDIPRL